MWRSLWSAAAWVTLAMPVLGADRGPDYEILDAAGKGDVAKVNELLAKNPGLVKAVGGWKVDFTPLHEAAFQGKKNTAAVLLDHKADPNATSRFGSPVHVAVWFGHPEVAELLLSKGGKLDVYSAVGLGKLDQVKDFLKREKKLLETQDFDGNTPLHWAAQTGQRPVAEWLLDQKADISVGSKGWRMTPLHYAAQGGHDGVVALFLARGANVRVRDDSGLTPLHEAARFGRVKAARLLLRAGADVNAAEDGLNATNAFFTTPSRWTPLHYAARCGHAEMVKLLLANKADRMLKDREGKTAGELADSKAVADLLR